MDKVWEVIDLLKANEIVLNYYIITLKSQRFELTLKRISGIVTKDTWEIQGNTCSKRIRFVTSYNC